MFEHSVSVDLRGEWTLDALEVLIARVRAEGAPGDATIAMETTRGTLFSTTATTVRWSVARCPTPESGGSDA